MVSDMYSRYTAYIYKYEVINLFCKYIGWIVLFCLIDS